MLIVYKIFFGLIVSQNLQKSYVMIHWLFRNHENITQILGNYLVFIYSQGSMRVRNVTTFPSSKN